MHTVVLYDVPALYDLIIGRGPCEAFYRDLARQTGGPVLELACGTGRLTLPLAHDGYARLKPRPMLKTWRLRLSEVTCGPSTSAVASRWWSSAATRSPTSRRMRTSRRASLALPSTWPPAACSRSISSTRTCAPSRGP